MTDNQHRDEKKFMEEELARRLDIYNDFKPGMPECPIKPLTIKGLMPAILISAFLTIYQIYAMFNFTSLFPQ